MCDFSFYHFASGWLNFCFLFLQFVFLSMECVSARCCYSIWKKSQSHRLFSPFLLSLNVSALLLSVQFAFLHDQRASLSSSV